MLFKILKADQHSIDLSVQPHSTIKRVLLQRSLNLQHRTVNSRISVILFLYNSTKKMYARHYCIYRAWNDRSYDTEKQLCMNFTVKKPLYISHVTLWTSCVCCKFTVIKAYFFYPRQKLLFGHLHHCESFKCTGWTYLKIKHLPSGWALQQQPTSILKQWTEKAQQNWMTL